MSRRYALGALLLGALSCRYPATAMLVRLDSDLRWGPGMELDEVELHVWSGAVPAGSTESALLFSRRHVLGAGAGRFAFPGTVTLERRGAVGTPVTVEAVAYRAGIPLFATRAIAQFQERRTVLLDLYLAGRCRVEAATCDPTTQSCGRAGCANIARDTLPVLDPADAGSVLAPPGDAGPEASALDAAAEAAMDAPAEADSGSADALDASLGEAGAETGVDAGAEVLVDSGFRAPHPVSPLSGSVLAGAQVPLRWMEDRRAMVDGVRVCRDRALGVSCMDLGRLATSSAMTPMLSAGVYFWALRQGAAAVGPGWEFRVPVRAVAPVVRASVQRNMVDLNGDGYEDLAVGAMGSSSQPGRVFVYFGGASGLPSAPSQQFSAPAPSGFDLFGQSVAGAGDVDGDGYGDLVVGLPGAAPRGGAVLYFGSPTGLLTAAPLVLPNTLPGNFGWSVAGLGDTDGDGYGEVAVGCTTGASFAGQVLVYSGGTSRVSVGAPRVLTGTAAGDLFGQSVAGVGDVDGDGYQDLLVGIMGAFSEQGTMQLYRGSPSGLTADTLVSFGTARSDFGVAVSGAGDVDGDGFADVVVGASRMNMDQGRAWVVYGATPPSGARSFPLDSSASAGFFGLAVSSAGDVDGDGYADVLVGEPNFDPGTQSGGAYLFRGSASGLALSGAPLRSMATNTSLGSGLTAGDYDGDGYDDPAVGAHNASMGTGRVFVARGGPAVNLQSPTWILNGPGPTSLFGYCLAR